MKIAVMNRRSKLLVSLGVKQTQVNIVRSRELLKLMPKDDDKKISTNGNIRFRLFSSSKMDMNTRLISMVEARPCIWDKGCSDYRDKAVKDQAWVEIFKEFEPLYDTLKTPLKKQIETTVVKKWYNIRDAYVKSRRLTGHKRNRPYIYTEYLKFLDNHINVDGNMTTFYEIEDKIEPNDMENSVDTDNNQSENWLESMNDNNEIYVRTEEEPMAKRLRVDQERSAVENEDNIVAVLANLLQKEEDEDRAFFKSITPSVKKLSEKSKLEFRIQVMQLVKELRAQDNKQKDSDDDSDS